MAGAGGRVDEIPTGCGDCSEILLPGIFGTSWRNLLRMTNIQIHVFEDSVILYGCKALGEFF